MNVYRAEAAIRWLNGIINVMYFLMWGVAIYTVIGVVVDLVNGPEWGAMPLSINRVGVVLPDSLRKVESSSWHFRTGEIDSVEGWVETSDSPFLLKAITLVAFAIAVGLSLFWLNQLRKVFRSVRAGTPFDPQNWKRLRWIGIAMLLTVLVEDAHAIGMSVASAQSLTIRGLELTPVIDVDWTSILFALVILCLAEIFARGAALEEEQALTV